MLKEIIDLLKKPRGESGICSHNWEKEHDSSLSMMQKHIVRTRMNAKVISALFECQTVVSSDGDLDADHDERLDSDHDEYPYEGSDSDSD